MKTGFLLVHRLSLHFRSLTAIVGSALLLAPCLSVAAEDGEGVGYDTVQQLQSEKRKQRKKAQKALIEAGDRSLLAGLVDSLFFIPREHRTEALEVLESLTGEDLGQRYFDWVEWVGAHPEIEPLSGYPQFKAELLSRIDPRYAEILYEGAPARVPLTEVVWGGVRVDEIPTLMNPDTIPGVGAEYLGDGELVFGAVVNGEYRAYPLRIMDWHELLNDEIGGEPVVLSYCTLCRSGILFRARAPDGERIRFGTSGLLYRSNKLMFDHETESLWSNLTGEPVVGKLAKDPVGLEVLPLTLTTWGEWRWRHPTTTVLDLELLAFYYPFDYQPGAADEARTGVSFPVWKKDDRLERKEEVYALRLDGNAKAFVVESALSAGVVNDAVGPFPVVVVADSRSGSIRVYERGERSFRWDAEDRLVDDRGKAWSLTEEALASTNEAGDVEQLGRLPGHVAFWFGWYGFYPDTEVWGD
jgi:hypothetical protein